MYCFACGRVGAPLGGVAEAAQNYRVVETEVARQKPREFHLRWQEENTDGRRKRR